MSNLVSKAKGLYNDVKYYWKESPKGRYMSFKEIAAYSFGGIGAYLIVCMSYAGLLGTTNVFISGTLGVSPTDMYILYVLSIIASVPLTGVRANIIDNTRNRAGKYRPYILSMGIPSVILYVGFVWFPYDMFTSAFGTAQVFGKSADYVAKCAVILVFNFLLQFFYNFFYDSYENLIHVLSPSSQERADVASIKSVVYSLGPSIVNLIFPIVAQNVFHTNSTDIRVYRLVYPILGVIGIGLCIVVYANTREKIIQAKTHIIQIKFIDALKAVAKNKYFWIISLAGWLGFLETAYSNILNWLYNYGGACSGNQFGIIITLNGNSALWGMIMAPFFIRKWGKKAVLIVTNILNVIFILAMLIFVREINAFTIWGVLICLYMNGVVGAFAHILNPAIQADIRDYQQYKTGERIDGMFAAVATIGSVLTLILSGVVPALQEHYGMNAENAKRVINDITIMSTKLPGGDGKTIMQMLAEQKATGQDILAPANALYDVNGVLIPLLTALIIFSAIGAVFNFIPYFWYDFDERKQKCVINVLKLRAMFEDYGNKALNNHQLVEAVDMVNNSKEMAVAEPKNLDKNYYKSISDKAERKAAKKEYKNALKYNDDIIISKFICEELDKFNSDLYIHEVQEYQKIYALGLDGIKNTDLDSVKAQLKKAKAMPKKTSNERKFRAFEISLAKDRLSAKKYFDKYYGNVKDFVEPDIENMTKMFDESDNIYEEIHELNSQLSLAKKAKEFEEIRRIKSEISRLSAKDKALQKQTREIMDDFAKFNRAAKPYKDAEKILIQKENYSHFDEIAALYDEAKIKAEEEDRIKAENAEKKRLEEQAELEKRKAEKKNKK